MSCEPPIDNGPCSLEEAANWELQIEIKQLRERITKLIAATKPIIEYAGTGSARCETPFGIEVQRRVEAMQAIVGEANP